MRSRQGAAIFKRIHSSISIVGLSVLTMFLVGIDSCSEPQEYCKIYSVKQDQIECTLFCQTNNDFSHAPNRATLIRACQLGQLRYLSNIQESTAVALLDCDRKFKDHRDYARSCRQGVTAEDLRISKSRIGAGTSSDRETGNNR